jgi:DNA-binding response OmpR family regulator
LVDYNLEEHLTGIELVNEMPETWKNLPCIVISADNSDERRKQSQSSGYGFIPKPVIPEILAEKMKQLLGRDAGSK